jgi:hypothetical protein
MKTEELSQQVFDYFTETVAKIGDFAAKEVPPFITEYLNWQFFNAAINVTLWIVPFLLFIGFLCVNLKAGNWAHKKLTGEAVYPVISLLVSIGVSIGFLLSFFAKTVDDIKDMVQIKIAPKVYLIEKAAEIVKGNVYTR